MSQTKSQSNAARETVHSETLYIVTKRHTPATVTKSAPVFVAAHEQKFHYLGDPTERVDKKKDSVRVGNCLFEINAIDEVKPWKNGGGCAFVMSEGDANTYRFRQEEIRRLKLELENFVNESVPRSRKVAKKDCI